MKAFKKILDRVIEPRSSTYNYGARNIAELDDTNFFFFDSWRFFLAIPVYISAVILSLVFNGLYYLGTLFVE